jgi:hypothetical protein
LHDERRIELGPGDKCLEIAGLVPSCHLYSFESERSGDKDVRIRLSSCAIKLAESNNAVPWCSFALPRRWAMATQLETRLEYALVIRDHQNSDIGLINKQNDDAYLPDHTVYAEDEDEERKENKRKYNAFKRETETAMRAHAYA